MYDYEFVLLHLSESITDREDLTLLYLMWYNFMLHFNSDVIFTSKKPTLASRYYWRVIFLTLNYNCQTDLSLLRNEGTLNWIH